MKFLKLLNKKAAFGTTFAYQQNQLWIVIPFLLCVGIVVSSFSFWGAMLPFQNGVFLIVTGCLLSVLVWLCLSSFLVAPFAGVVYEKKLTLVMGENEVARAYSWLESDKETEFKFIDIVDI